MKKNWIIILTASLLTVWACSTSDDTPDANDPVDPDPDPVSFDRSAMLTNWADNIIMPGYTDMAAQLEALTDAGAAFSNDPNQTTLDALRTSWLTAYTTWQRVSMFEIGPAEVVSLRLNVNIYPTDTDLIESLIAGGNYNLGLPSNRVAKGFPALDYLLYGLAESDDDLLIFYTDGSGQAYRDYLTDIIADMSALVNQVKNEWEDSYRSTFVNNNGSSATASTDRLVNDVIFYYEKFLRAGKMGIPLGVFSGTAEPQTLEARFNGEVGKEFFLEGLDAVQDFFNGRAYNGGAQGSSLKTYLDALNAVKDGADLSGIINTQINAARSAVQGLGSFSDEIENNPPTAMLTAYDEVQKVVPLFKVDMVSAMSISIDFVDADGD